ncbi:malto-oligosyltrehalose trehalohydrolase [Pseudorhizobium tarimense]|uniref:Malto-oligosyltrehalose trehalohydrolase n=1 Tax=Pseudorhizobium tarimense TaxID=1079109 RepID=A0ABV2H7K5_9HYPH|nr:malto-oligosyltrehalose trehalohydrolase [Pseudorhizobium tarimense]MCJ8519635.1 malto-oligosyltrehalose trehalohydrolase [Pseudorhizobium tarimense]
MTSEIDANTEFRAFPKTWGAEFVAVGEVRFRVWAPGQEEVILRLDTSETPMSRSNDGWFELLATGVTAATEYAFVLADGTPIPDPASRGQKDEVNGPSLVIDPTNYEWQNAAWKGRPWEEAVIYEMHVGTFTEDGTFRAAIDKLPHLVELGITAVEIMPVAQFGGDRGWGYDGVLLYAPHSAYGTPEDMKAFIDAAHGHGLMVLLDVVYNHFGPEGNYLPLLAPNFFHPEKHTPWGDAIAYETDAVRRFFIENALYWLDEFNLDGLRFDAIDQIADEESEKHILVEIAERIRAEFPERRIHLTTEDARNVTFLHERTADGGIPLFTAEWNDDLHNAIHVYATGETDGYYIDFVEKTEHLVARTLAEGFAYQGEKSKLNGEKRGVDSRKQPPVAFIDFIQNHDQIGNRAFGDRLITLAGEAKVKALLSALLLSPHIPLLFMGEEFGETRPFLFFTDFQGELAKAVRDGRRREFEGHAGHGDEDEVIPDPNLKSTFTDCKLDWQKPETEDGRGWMKLTKQLLQLRREKIVPLIRNAKEAGGSILEAGDGVVAVRWTFPDGELGLAINLGDGGRPLPNLPGEPIFRYPAQASGSSLASNSVVVTATARGQA